MNIEMSPRSRSFVSALTAIAMTSLLAASFVESTRSVQWLGSGTLSASLSAASLDVRPDTAFVRSV